MGFEPRVYYIIGMYNIIYGSVFRLIRPEVEIMLRRTPQNGNHFLEVSTLFPIRFGTSDRMRFPSFWVPNILSVFQKRRAWIFPIFFREYGI